MAGHNQEWVASHHHEAQAYASSHPGAAEGYAATHPGAAQGYSANHPGATNNNSGGNHPSGGNHVTGHGKAQEYAASHPGAAQGYAASHPGAAQVYAAAATSPNTGTASQNTNITASVFLVLGMSLVGLAVGFGAYKRKEIRRRAKEDERAMRIVNPDGLFF